jgi:hypothetical protein
MKAWQALPQEHQQAMSEQQRRKWFEERILIDSASSVVDEKSPLTLFNADGQEMPQTSPETVAEDVDFVSDQPYLGPRQLSSSLGGIYIHSKMGIPTVTISDPDLARDVLSRKWDRIIEGDKFPSIVKR